MTKAYIVYQQEYEEVYIYGVFPSKECLDDALTILSQNEMHLSIARERAKEHKKWYENIHKPWAEQGGRKPTKPYSMTVDIHEYCKSIFDVHEIEVNEIILDPNVIGADLDKCVEE